MKCHWAGIAAIGAAVPLGLAGIFALRGRPQGNHAAGGPHRRSIGRDGDSVPHPPDRGMRQSDDDLQHGYAAYPDRGGHRGHRASIALFVLAREPELPTVEVAA
jgi:hypothetical protein